MSMPGFTAEATLGEVVGTYRPDQRRFQVDTPVTPAYVHSAFLGTVACFGRCVGNCPSLAGSVSRDCYDNCARYCGGRPFIPSVTP